MSFEKDPVRLVFDPGSPAAQVELLRHDASFKPPRGAEERVWLSLVGAVATAGGATARAPGKTTTLAVKMAVVVLGLGLLAAVVLLGRPFGTAPTMSPPIQSTPPIPPHPSSHTLPGPPVSTWTPPPPPEPMPDDRSPWGEAATETPRARPAAGTPKSVRVKRQPAAQAGVEQTLLEEARRALRGGDPARALALLETCSRLFPSGGLEREREWLTIQSLVGTVRGREAKERAAAFLSKFPDDPHARDIRALGLGGPVRP